MIPHFYGWVVVACAFLVLFLTYGVQYSFGIFVPPMIDELGWQRASLGGAFSLYTFVYTGFSLLSGRLTDVWGPRRVVALGGIFLGLGIITTSQVSTTWQLYLAYGIIAALGMSTAYIPCNITVVRWFQRRRGLALGIASCGASSGILVMPLLGTYLIDAAGWRTALLVLGLGMLILINIGARFMIRDPEQMGLRPDGLPPSSGTGNDAPETVQEGVSGLTLKEARRTASFWMFLLAFTVALLTITVPFVHLPTFALDLNLSPLKGAMAVSVIGIFAFIGSITLGSWSDAIGYKTAMVLAIVADAIAFVLFAYADSVIILYVGAAIFGLSYGGFASLFPALVGDLFGRAHAGAIGGFIFGSAGVLGAWGPAFVGYLRDIQPDYQFAFLLCALMAALATFLFALIPRAARV